MLKNYYQTLGLESNASTNEVKKAYRMYASKLHPDKQNGDKFFEERFKEINEAYEVLSDVTKRANYDTKIISEYSNGASTNNTHSYSKSENDINKEKREYEKTERENERKRREEKIKVKKNVIYYTGENISVNGSYININGLSYCYLLDDYEFATLRKDAKSNFVFSGVLLIIVGILTIPFLFGLVFIAWGFYGLYHQEYILVLVNEKGDTDLTKGRKRKMKLIASKINQAKKN